MSLKEILLSGGGLIVLLTLVQISPLKIDPWTALAKAIGRAINSDTLKRVNDVEQMLDSVSKQLEKMNAEQLERDIVSCRMRILRFGDEVLHGVEHSKEHYCQILRDITEYEHYCSEHPNFPNDNTVLTSQMIKDAYVKRWDKRDFL